MRDFVALGRLEVALQSNGHALAQAVVVVELKGVGAHAHNLRALRELRAQLAAQFVGQDAHVALGVADAFPIEHDGAHDAAEVVAHERDTLVAEGGAGELGQVARDDDIFGDAPYLDGHFYLLLGRLVEYLKQPEGGRETEEKQENKELLVPDEGQAVPYTFEIPGSHLRGGLGHRESCAAG